MGNPLDPEIKGRPADPRVVPSTAENGGVSVERAVQCSLDLPHFPFIRTVATPPRLARLETIFPVLCE